MFGIATPGAHSAGPSTSATNAPAGSAAPARSPFAWPFTTQPIAARQQSGRRFWRDRVATPDPARTRRDPSPRHGSGARFNPRSRDRSRERQEDAATADPLSPMRQAQAERQNYDLATRVRELENTVAQLVEDKRIVHSRLASLEDKVNPFALQLQESIDFSKSIETRVKEALVAAEGSLRSLEDRTSVAFDKGHKLYVHDEHLKGQLLLVEARFDSMAEHIKLLQATVNRRTSD